MYAISVQELCSLSKILRETLSQEAILANTNGFRAAGVLAFYIDSGIYTTLRKYGQERILGIIPKHFNAAARKIMCGLKSEISPILML
ncbi:unnamed protein product [Rotaria magnacalcarata]|uniref:Uncharacterized protein n=1 Tax=Rotaria magnacalcarata TaxID=392030 RepID=A0A816R7X7_9BILA|nr:unnamed protein product [Rotaria magnacalcarata]CAF4115953.1 unnamed protein product [Rotaria magnacalcarata]CAF4149855.1 unnamed protein product [Rotaria magnacalcarata]